MKDKKALPWFFARYALITVGCVIYSLGVALFLDANSLAAGGVTGVAILISDLLDGVFPINAGMLIMIINVPLIIVSAFFFRKAFYSFHAVLNRAFFLAGLCFRATRI